MKKLLLVITVLIVMLSFTACDFGSSKKITMDEFNQIENGMSYSEVVQIIGSEGELLSESGLVKMYTWEGKGDIGANANVTFYNDKVEGKAQIGLR